VKTTSHTPPDRYTPMDGLKSGNVIGSSACLVGRRHHSGFLCTRKAEPARTLPISQRRPITPGENMAQSSRAAPARQRRPISLVHQHAGPQPAFPAEARRKGHYLAAHHANRASGNVSQASTHQRRRTTPCGFDKAELPDRHAGRTRARWRVRTRPANSGQLKSSRRAPRPA